MHQNKPACITWEFATVTDMTPLKFICNNNNLFANHITFDNGYMKCAHKRQRTNERNLKFLRILGI